MTRRPQHGDGNTLFGVLSAVVGSAAASQVTAPEKVDIYAAPDRARLEAEWEQADPEGVANLRATAAALDVHAALNTYEVAADVPAGTVLTTPDTLMVVGANRRRLVARWTPEGVWIGGCLIADEVTALALAAFITREDEGS